MTVNGRLAVIALSLLACGGCGSVRPNMALPYGEEAYKIVPDSDDGFNLGLIQAGDRLAIRVLGEPDLTSEQYWVDGAGRIQMPLAGEMKVGGRTPNSVREEVTAKLASGYIRHPRVSITIMERSKLSLTVEGEVQKSGRFEASPGITLLGAIALAGSTTKDVKFDEIYVFRLVEGKRSGARFNLSKIRNGTMPDPQILPGDVVVVGRSALKGTWHEFLQSTPLLGVYQFVK